MFPSNSLHIKDFIIWFNAKKDAVDELSTYQGMSPLRH